MKYLKLLLVFVSWFSIAQSHLNTPWLSDSSRTTNYAEIQALFDQYWQNKDKNIRADGFKPFMRGLYHWEGSVDASGNLRNPKELWKLWEEKNKFKKQYKTLTTPTSNWQPVGPFTHTNTGSWSSGQGRVNVVCVDPQNPNTIYIGAPAGGIWKSTNAGSSWTPLSDELPQIGVSGIAVHPTNSNIIYIATGDKDGWDTFSVGVLKSIDGGLTWNTTGLSFMSSLDMSGDIIIHPTNPDIIWVATTSGLYKSTNAGDTWDVKLSGNIRDIEIKPSNPNVVYAVTSSEFYKSTNAGDSFSQITSGVPSSTGRMAIGVTPANPNYVYILAANPNNTYNGIYRSTNSGTSFVLQNSSINVFESSKQAYYDMAIGVSSTNADVVFTGCLNVWKSVDGGVSSEKINNWSSPTSPTYTHADIHFLKYFDDKLYCGSDGGVYVSSDNGSSFTDITAGLQIGQFYKIAVARETASKMVGGLQDNGGYALSNDQWKNYYGADGMDTAIDPTDTNIYYGFTQFGGSLNITTDAGNSSAGSVSAPTTGNWVTPLAINNLGELFAGYDGLYKLQDNNWILHSSESFGEGNLDIIEIHPLDHSIMYVAEDSSLYKSSDAGLTFSYLTTFSNLITSISVHETNSNIVYLTTPDEVYKSINGGSSFTTLNEGLPDLTLKVIKHQAYHPNNPLYLGTTLGVYYRDDTLNTWEAFDTNLPNVEVTDLGISLEEGKLVAATYGRGIWQTTVPQYIAPIEVSLQAVTNPENNYLSCLENSIIPQVVIRNGGTNPLTSATISYNLDGGTNSTYNWTGNLAYNQTSTVTLPAITGVTKGSHIFESSVYLTNDFMPSNNLKKSRFYLTSPQEVGVLNTFETLESELLTYDKLGDNPWLRVQRNGGIISSPTTTYSTNEDGNYPDGKTMYLVSGCYDLTNVTNPAISFKLAYDTEPFFDILYMEYSTNGGSVWNLLGEAGTNWYNNSDTNSNNSDCSDCLGGQWTGTNASLQTYTYPLNEFTASSNIIFRFVFKSDQAVNAQGIIIDDFLISGTLANDTFADSNIYIFPNPSTGIFTVTTQGTSAKQIKVTDVLGKTLFESNVHPTTNTVIDLQQASAGIYYVNIFSEDKQIVKQIIKK